MDEAAMACVRIPSVASIQRMRQELGFVNDVMSAIALARAARYIQICHDQTDANKVCFMAANMLVEMGDGSRHEVMLRGALVSAGKTAALSLATVQGCLERMRKLLEKVIKKFVDLFPRATCPLPDPSGIDIAKLAGGSAMSDHASAATATSKLLVQWSMECFNHTIDHAKGLTDTEEQNRLLAEAVSEHARKILNSDGRIFDLRSLLTMSADQRTEILEPLIVGCARHAANLLIAAGDAAESQDLLRRFVAADEDFDSTNPDRLCLNVSDLLRAAMKLVDYGSATKYEKGDAHRLQCFMEEKYPGEVFLNSFRAELGGRADRLLAGAFELFCNRKYAVSFINERQQQEAEGKLRTAVQTALQSTEVVAALMVRAALWVQLFEDVRWFAASKDYEDETRALGNVAMSRVYQALQRALLKIEANGAELFNPTLSPFAELGSASYAVWSEKKVREVKQVIGTTVRVTYRQKVYGELLWKCSAAAATAAPADPDETNLAARPVAVELAGLWARALLEAMKVPYIADYLSGGQFDSETCSGTTQEKARAGYRNNDRMCESEFGLLKLVLHGAPTMAPQTCASLTGAIKQGTFVAPLHSCSFVHRPRQNPAQHQQEEEAEEDSSIFSFRALDSEVQEAIIRTVARERKDLLSLDKAELALQRENNRKRAEEKRRKKMDRMQKQLAQRHQLACQVRLVGSAEEVEREVALLNARAEANKRLKKKEGPAKEWLWKQIICHEDVYGRRDFRDLDDGSKLAKTSATVGSLKAHLIKKINGLRPEEIETAEPTHLTAMMPQQNRVLGTSTPQANDLHRKNVAEYKALVQRAIARATELMSSRSAPTRPSQAQGASEPQKPQPGHSILYVFNFEFADGPSPSKLAAVLGTIKTVYVEETSRPKRKRDALRKGECRALVRWDPTVYPDGHDEAESYVVLVPLYRNEMARKDGWCFFQPDLDVDEEEEGQPQEEMELDEPDDEARADRNELGSVRGRLEFDAEDTMGDDGDGA